MESSPARQNTRQGDQDQVSVDVTALTLSLREKFNQLHPISAERCIYRVPKRLRVRNEKAYTPQCVSIGPYHHGKDELKAMEEHKTLYLQHFLKYSKVSLDELVSCVGYEETKLRNCYHGKIDLSSEIFVSLVLVDAAFVIMVMLRSCALLGLSSFDQFVRDDDLLVYKPWMISDIRTDLMLLENQLPFFILNDLLLLSKLEIGSFSILQISSISLNSLFKVDFYQESVFSESKHLVHFLSIGQQPLDQDKYRELHVVKLPSAVELHRAGVKFKRGSSLRLADINFNFRDGILEIPHLRITGLTEVLFANLIAFEQSHLYHGYFNNYITIISFLLTNGNDVEILTRQGIIENWLRDNDQLVHLFCRLNCEVSIDTSNFYFTDVVNDLNKYCSKRRNGWRASLIQNYFYSPWSIISVSAAAAVILLTAIQTVCSILQL